MATRMVTPTRGILLSCVGLLFVSGWVGAWSDPGRPTGPPVAPKESLALVSERRRSVLQKVVATAFLRAVGTSGPATAVPLDAVARSDASDGRLYTVPPKAVDGKVILVTGGTAGLGLESAKRLAASGGTIVLTARTDAKGTKAVAAVQDYLTEKSVRNPNVYALELDLDDLDSVKSFPQRYGKLLGSRKIDVLMNNAGVAAIPERETTKDGFERTFQTNHLGPFILTSLMFPYLNREGRGSRIINVSSRAHQFAKVAKTNTFGLDFDNLNAELEYGGSGWPAYSRSKLENILFTQELQRRADEAGLTWLAVVALHPGVVATDIWRATYFGVDQRGARKPEGKERVGGSLKSFASDFFYNKVIPVEEGANTQIMLAASGEGEGIPVKGQYFDEQMKPSELSDFAKNQESARYLWDKSQELAGIEFKVI